MVGVHKTGRLDGSSFMWHKPCQRCKYNTSMDIKKKIKKMYFPAKASHSCRITCKHSKPARERRIELYKSSQQQQAATTTTTPTAHTHTTTHTQPHTHTHTHTHLRAHVPVSHHPLKSILQLPILSKTLPHESVFLLPFCTCHFRGSQPPQPPSFIWHVRGTNFHVA